MKSIKDPVHGIITLSNIAVSIIDTDVFQRLKDIKQLGLCYQVYPSANHTRFEHSIGVYHLAKEMIIHLQKNQPELNITNKLVELVSIAGLTHDIGHACYSHLFDNCLKDLSKELGISDVLINHENRSMILLKYIVSKTNILLTDSDIELICNLIEPKESNNEYYFQIVSNKINQIDVDKFDYIARDSCHLGLPYKFDYDRVIKNAVVIKNNICYPEKLECELNLLFHTRYILHKQVYNHHTVKGLEYLLIDILKSCKYIFKMVSIPEEFITLTDTILDVIKFNKVISKETMNLIERFKRREHYKCFYEKKIICKFSKKNLKNYIKLTLPNVDIDNLIIEIYNIGYFKSNPLNNIIFYKNKNKYEIENYSKYKINHSVEMGLRIYYKTKIETEPIEDVVNNFIVLDIV